MIEVLKDHDYPLIPLVYAKGFADKAWEEDWYKISQFNKETVWVYKDKEIKAFIISFYAKSRPYISVLTVVPESTRKGIASKLLNHCIYYWLKDYDSIYLHVEKDNPPAIKLYKKHGFEVIEEDQVHYYMKREKTWKK